jgi:hypothetical protein
MDDTAEDMFAFICLSLPCFFTCYESTTHVAILPYAKQVCASIPGDVFATVYSINMQSQGQRAILPWILLSDALAVSSRSKQTKEKKKRRLALSILWQLRTRMCQTYYKDMPLCLETKVSSSSASILIS